MTAGPTHLVDVDVDVERKQAQAIASLPDSITHYYAYSNKVGAGYLRFLHETFDP